MLTMPRLIANDVFFREHYRPIMTLAAHLSGELVPFRQATTLDATIDPLVADLIELCRQTHAILGIAPNRAYAGSIAGAVDAVFDTAALAEHIPDNLELSTSLGRLSEHSGYFAERFDQDVDYARGRFADASKKTLFFEVIFNCANIILAGIGKAFVFSPEDPRQATTFFDHAAVRDACDAPSMAVIEACQRELPGWCSEGKTWLLYDLVRRTRPAHVVEIGIFGGRSIVPIAQALRDNGEGIVTGIEAWTAEAATEDMTNVGNTFWWACLDFAPIKRGFLEFVVTHRLTQHIRLIEAPSKLAHHCIDGIDLLHIDGNHSLLSCAQDVVNYFGKLRPGGILVFDDINWVTTHPALEIVMRCCTLLHTTTVADDSLLPGCAAFVKI